MTNEKLKQFQFSHPLSSFIVQFSSTPIDIKLVPGCYPGFDWHKYSSTVGEVDGLVFNLRKQRPNLMSMDLFRALVERIQSDSSFKGRTSHLFLSLFNRGYFGNGEGLVETGLDKEIWDSDTGQPVNPTF